MEKIKTAKKTYSCDICGCNIEKSTQYKVDTIWNKGHVDDDGDWCNGYMKTFREHVNGSQCDIAIRKVQDEFKTATITL